MRGFGLGKRGLGIFGLLLGGGKLGGEGGKLFAQLVVLGFLLDEVLAGGGVVKRDAVFVHAMPLRREPCLLGGEFALVGDGVIQIGGAEDAVQPVV